MLLRLVFIGLLVSSPAAALAASKLAVLPLKATRLVPEVVEILDELLIGEIALHDSYEVIGASDINALLGLERMKEAMGCDDVACAAEIGGALGAEYLVAGSIGELGGEIILTLKLIAVGEQAAKGRVTLNAPRDEAVYRDTIKKAVAQLFGEKQAAASEVASTIVADLSSPMFKRFELAQLDRAVYLDFVASGLSYSAWARHYNEETESLALDLTKWTFTGTAALVLSVMLLTREPDESVGMRIGISMPMLLSAAAVWGLDLANVGDAPDPLPEL